MRVKGKDGLSYTVMTEEYNRHHKEDQKFTMDVGEIDNNELDRLNEIRENPRIGRAQSAKKLRASDISNRLAYKGTISSLHRTNAKNVQNEAHEMYNIKKEVKGTHEKVSFNLRDLIFYALCVDAYAQKQN